MDQAKADSAAAQLEALTSLAQTHVLGSLLTALTRRHRGYDLVAHWKQGEFHHDLVLRVHAQHGLPGALLVVATNCNGGVKEVLCFDRMPDRYALWHMRCPENPEFEGELTGLLGAVRTLHWFDPCELLAEHARSELKASCRQRQRGGGFEPLR
ncbi:MAG: hypothetical protein JWN48_952 [Myxococcaceae bacterium]|nr:hypothetical protein [Myxococcaceae bacterium]